jgi:D-glucuronyl C5-epimerase C-terminus
MAQGTALQALGRAGKVFGPDPYFQVGSQALSLFTVPPPVGVRVGTPLGARYLQYSFASGTDIINAFLQSLIGLYEYASTSGSTEAQSLFAAGNAQAEAELPRFDTGAWSLYQPGIEDDLSYHVLVTGFLDQLCGLLHVPVYCTTAKHFHTYMKTPPVLRLLTTHARRRRPFTLRFTLSKYSNVGVVVSRGSSDVFLTSADFPYGTDTFSIPPLRRGNYIVLLRATDLPGNTSRITGALRVR